MSAPNVALTETWLVDGRVDLTATCASTGWHRGSTIRSLITAGISRTDAEAFVAFRFALSARGGRDPESYLTDEQNARLTAEVAR